MSENEFYFHGWSLSEALRRTVDRDLLLACIEQSRSRSTDTQPPSLTRDMARLEFRQHLTSGHLVSFGRRESPTAELRPIPAAAWRTLEFKDFKRSIAVDGVRRIFDVRIFPVLGAPNALDQLDLMPIAEACRRFVFEDPQLITLRKRAIAIGGQLHEFGWDWPPYGKIWPVDLWDTSAWDHLLGSLEYFDDRKKYMRTRAADFILGERFARLIDFLRRGVLIAEGITKNGLTAVIPKSIWHRHRSHLDVNNGDILEYVPRANDSTQALSRPIYIGLTLKKASTGLLHVKPTAYDQLRQSTMSAISGYVQRLPRPRPVADDLAKVLLNTQLEDLAKARRWKEIASRIGDQMQKPPRSDADFLALAKAVRRHFQAKSPE